MRILGVDVGDRRIGLAISDSSGTLARPVVTVHRAGSLEQAAAQTVEEILRLAAEADDTIELAVVGLPVHLDGTPGEQTARVKAFAEALHTSSGIPVVFHDERLSSREAERRLAATERDWRKRKRRLDAAAAAVILQDYLDSRRPTDARRAPGADHSSSEQD